MFPWQLIINISFQAWSSGRLQHVPLMFVPNLSSGSNNNMLNRSAIGGSSSSRLVVQPDFDASLAYGLQQQQQQQQRSPQLFSAE